MNLYLDTEFDGHMGDLISLALAADDGRHWYGIWPRAEDIYLDPWVKEHVIPQLGNVGAAHQCVRGSDPWMRQALKEYLKAREGCTIWADWPADFEHLMRLMAGPSYSESFMIPCALKLINTPEGEPKPEHPHNALSDAIALMRWHQGVQNAA